MKSILAIMMAGAVAQACPNINDTFVCTFSGPGYSLDADMAIKTEAVPGGQKMTMTVSVGGETNSDTIVLNPVSDRTDEDGIRAVSSCQGDRVITVTSFNNLKASQSVSVKNGDLVIEGQTISVYFDEDAQGNVVPGSKEYVVEDSNLTCKKK
jgi:hypothetical protein